MGRFRLSLITALAALVVAFLPKAAQATICSVPYSFTTGTTIQAGPFNANFNSLQACGNNIDNSNIGASGIYASQLIPTNPTQATFGGTQAYTFSNGLSAGPITLTGAVAAPTVTYIASDGSSDLILNAPAGDQISARINGSSILNFTSTGPVAFSQVTAPNAGYGFGSTAGSPVLYSDGTNTLLKAYAASASTIIQNNAGGAAITVLNNLSTQFSAQINPGNGGTIGTAGIYGGTGAPSFSAPNGSLFVRYDGGNGARFYLNTSGASTSGTTWTNEF